RTNHEIADGHCLYIITDLVNDADVFMSHGVAVDVISAAVRPQVRAAHARCGDTDNRIGGLFQNRVGAPFNTYISGGVHYDTTHVGLLYKTMFSVTTSRG